MIEEIQPTYMVDPSNLWFTLKSEPNNDDYFTRCMIDNQTARQFGDRVWYTPEVGEVVMIWCRRAKIWARGLVNTIDEEIKKTTLKVFYIDHGTAEVVRLEDVQKLPEADKFRQPGKACKLILFGIVPITKMECISPKTGEYGLQDCFAEKWDPSTYSYVANILKTHTRFFLDPAKMDKEITCCVGNRVVYGDLNFAVNSCLVSIGQKLSEEKYGMKSTKKFKEFFLDPQPDCLLDLGMGPKKVLHAEHWQMDLDKLVTVKDTYKKITVKEESLETEIKLKPFELEEWELEFHEKKALAEIEKDKAEADAAQARANVLMMEQRRTEENKIRYRLPTIKERLCGFKEIEDLKNACRVVGLTPIWAELRDGEESIVRYTAATDPSSIFVMLTMNAGLLADLQQEIVQFVQKFHFLRGQFLPKIGLYCLAFFEAEKVWYRARIVKWLPENRVTVFFVDVGDYLDVNGNMEIMPISKDLMMGLPFQAIECKLKGIQQLSDDEVWTEESIDSVFEFCLDEEGYARQLCATFHGESAVECDPGRKKFEVDLTRKGDDDRQISLSEIVSRLTVVEPNKNKAETVVPCQAEVDK